MIDLGSLGRIFKTFAEITGFGIGLAQHPSDRVLLTSGWSDLCARFHRGSPSSQQVCEKGLHDLFRQAGEPGVLIVRECGHGAADCALPVFIEGAHVASLFTGQAFIEAPDRLTLRNQVEQYGYNSEEYLKAASRLPVVMREELANKASFLTAVAVIIEEMALQNMETKKRAELVEKEMRRHEDRERTLAAGERRFRTVLNSLNDGVLSCDPETGLIMDVDERVCEIFGWTGAEAQGLPVMQVFGDEPQFSGEEAVAFLRRAATEALSSSAGGRSGKRATGFGRRWGRGTRISMGKSGSW
ncbi:MAG TPA: PocR ligand-binding domain-containing protein [Syntrophorhabdaceae bacterium]